LIMEFPRFRSFTFIALVGAFTFGMGTLWIDSLWPFVLFQAVIVSIACLWFCVAAFRPQLQSSYWLMLPFLVAALGAMQFLFGRTVNAWETRQSVFEWVTHGCAAVLAFHVCRDKRFRLITLRTFALASGALALLSTIQNYSAPGRVLWLFDSGYSGGVFGPFVNHTKLANFAELAIPVALWLALHDRRCRPVYAATGVVLAASVVASASRGGIVVLVLEFAILCVIAGRRYNRGISIRTALAFTAALTIGVAVSGWELAWDRFSIDPLRDLRLPIASSSIEMARRYWLTGSGLGTWSFVYPAFAHFDIHVLINQAHCDWLQWLDEGGVLFPGIMVLMSIVAIRSARREWWALGVVFVWFHGFWDYPMQQTPAFASLQIAFWGAGLTTGMFTPKTLAGARGSVEAAAVQDEAGPRGPAQTRASAPQNSVRCAVGETHLPF
jgi:O-antigen ligase/polysaccharide polymerase Wzy-like membrane protein